MNKAYVEICLKCGGINKQAGTHGSAWKYCCSLIGAAPAPYYKAGEALMNHDYDKVLKNRIHDKSVPVRDTYQQLKTAPIPRMRREI